jgi:hypothetical protein
VIGRKTPSDGRTGVFVKPYNVLLKSDEYRQVHVFLLVARSRQQAIRLALEHLAGVPYHHTLEVVSVQGIRMRSRR